MGYTENVALLLTIETIDVNIKTDNYGDTALHWASWNGHSSIVELLLKFKNIDAKIKNKYGKTPLDLAADENLNETK